MTHPLWLLAGLLEIFSIVKMRATWLELEQLLFRADKNGDGHVDLHHFLLFVQGKLLDPTHCQL